MRGQDDTPEDVPHVSASQVSAFTQCERAWYFDKVLGVPRPQTGAQGKGVAVHSYLEAVVKNQTPTGAGDIPQIVAPVWDILTPGDLAAAVAEVDFRIPTYEGGPDWVGFIDLHFPYSNPLRIVDYKTTSDLRYAKTAEDLAQDVQMISYGKWALDKFPEVETVRLQHIYIATKGKPKAKLISVDVDRPQVLSIWERDVAKVRRMDALRVALPNPDDVAPTGVDTGQCSAYGGCPFRDRCGLVPNTLSSAFRKTLTGETAKMDTTAPATGLLAKIQALRARTTGATEAAPAPAPTPVAAEAVPVTVVPPDAPPRTQPAAEAAPVTVTGQDDVRDVEITTTAAENGVVTHAVTETKKRGRPPGAKNAPAAPAAPAPGEVADLLARANDEIQDLRERNETLRRELSAAKDKAQAVAASAPQITIGHELTLYVDCFPVKGPDREQAQLFADWISPIAAAVAESNGVADYRLLSYHAPKVALAAGIKTVRDAGQLPGVLVINSTDSGADIALEALTPFARRIVRRA